MRMKKVHGETKHMRIERMTATIKEFLNPKQVKFKLPEDSVKAEIIPDQNFITQNTAELNLMLESIPQEVLNYDEDIFEKDFKEVLNSAEIKYDQEDMSSFKCDKCKFRATSARCLNAHVKFVHCMSFFKCQY